jgi:hypothetical protein
MRPYVRTVSTELGLSAADNDQGCGEEAQEGEEDEGAQGTGLAQVMVLVRGRLSRGVRRVTILASAGGCESGIRVGMALCMGECVSRGEC